MLLPSRLRVFAGLNKELILATQIDRIEVWDRQTYDSWAEAPDPDFEMLAEEVMGDELHED